MCCVYYIYIAFNIYVVIFINSKPRFEAWESDCTGYYRDTLARERRGEAAAPAVKPYQCLMDEEIILGQVEFNLNPYALDYPTCPKVDGNRTAATDGSGGRGGGRFGGAERLQFLRHTYGDEPRCALSASNFLRDLHVSLYGTFVGPRCVPRRALPSCPRQRESRARPASHFNGFIIDEPRCSCTRPSAPPLLFFFLSLFSPCQNSACPPPHLCWE